MTLQSKQLVMKRDFSNRSYILICITLTSCLLFSCRDKSPDVKAKGIPQTISQNNSTDKPSNVNNVNFVPAAKATTPGVVHIKTVYEINSGNFSYKDGRVSAPSVGSGSGVIISADGYIVTNNHVVANAKQIEVVLTDRRAFTAKLIGLDPNTDLALLKVDAKDLHIVELGNSDNVEIGEWVLAVGYPFSLSTTVTAGIISAKGRSIGVINSNSSASSQGSSAIESFIQTDAAINPGNSGGALVDIDGKLIGINTTIVSSTGSYAGYSFAIPVNLAKKILDDLREFGMVKRGLLGVSFPAPAAEDLYLKQQGINPGSVKGVFITGIQKGSAAEDAGLKEGDIIQGIDDIQLFSSAEFSERIARHRPGDKIKLGYLRQGKFQQTTATLKSEETQKSMVGDPESLKNIYAKLGAKLSPITPALKERYSLDAGVIVTEILTGGLFDQLGIPPGTIIAYINGKSMHKLGDIDRALIEAQNSRVQVLGIAPDGSRIAFDISLGA